MGLQIYLIVTPNNYHEIYFDCISDIHAEKEKEF
jgi:hypothetical protein